jgi:hypothetical protein
MTEGQSLKRRESAGGRRKLNCDFRVTGLKNKVKFNNIPQYGWARRTVGKLKGARAASKGLGEN